MTQTLCQLNTQNYLSGGSGFIKSVTFKRAGREREGKEQT